METLRLQRTDEYNNRFRNYRVYIDGKKAGVIANGETMNFDLFPGPHILCCKIDWCSSPEIPFNLKQNETKIFQVGGFKNGNKIMPVALFLSLLLYIPKRLGVNYKYVLYLIIPVVFLMVYYLSIGRNKYLTLSELQKA